MRRSKGFTLIELMIVVAIVGILAAIALPLYNEQIRKGRRADAMRAVGGLQLQLERWRAENPSYAPCTPTPCGSGVYPTAPTSTFYTIAITGPGTSAYTITATPKANDRCGALTATRANPKPTWATAGCN